MAGRVFPKVLQAISNSQLEMSAAAIRLFGCESQDR